MSMPEIMTSLVRPSFAIVSVHKTANHRPSTPFVPSMFGTFPAVILYLDSASSALPLCPFEDPAFKMITSVPHVGSARSMLL